MYREKTIKKIVSILLSTLIFVLCLSGCSAVGKTLTERNNREIIKLKIDDEVEIRLESNPTTGYSWFLNENVDETIVSISDPVFLDSEKDKELVGAGGYEVFTLKAISKGKTIIILNYKRPWEEGEDPIKTFEITVSVE